MAVHVTIFTNGSKFQLDSNFMESHALTLAVSPLGNRYLYIPNYTAEEVGS